MYNFASGDLVYYISNEINIYLISMPYVCK